MPQLEFNTARTQTAIHRRRFNRKYAALQGKIDQDELDKFLDPIDGQVIIFKEREALEPIVDAPLSNEVYVDTSLLKQEFEDMAGVGRNQRGVPGSESATEAEIVETHIRASEWDDHELMMRALGQAATKLHRCIEANLTQAGAIPILGPAGIEWMPFGPEMLSPIDAEVVFEVKVDSAVRETLQVERAQLLQLIDIVGKNPLIALSPVLMREVMNKFPALANNEALIAELQQIAAFAIQGQLVNKGGTGATQQQTQKPDAASSPKQAQEANQVSTGG